MKIYRPAKDYDQSLLALTENIENALNSIVKKSGISTEENRRLTARYKDCVEDAKDTKDNIEKLRRKKMVYILGAYFLVSTGVYMIYCGCGVFRKSLAWYDPETILTVLMLPLGFVCLCAVILPIRKIQNEISPALSDMQKLQSDLDAKVQEAEEACRTNLRPFLDLLHDGLTAEIINKTLEEIEIDPYFSEYRADSIRVYDPDFFTRSSDQSTLDVISGESSSNPFIIRKTLRHYMGTQTYTGERSIEIKSWERETDGSWTLRSQSETLTASVTMPRPFYRTSTDLVYACAEVPDLCFSHEANPEQMNNPAKREKIVRSRIAELSKKHRRDLQRYPDTDSITPMSNTQFEGMFAAFDRNNELEFRRMFVPSAQENIIDLLSSPSFGDYFHFYKQNMITRIKPADNTDWDMDMSLRCCTGFDYEEIRRQFTDYTRTCFINLYKMLAPILCIPMYRNPSSRKKSHTESATRPSGYMAEVLANKIGAKAILGRETNLILTALEESQDEQSSLYHLDVFYYDEVSRITTVQKKASDNKMYDIDIPWIEYIPCHKTLSLRVLSEKTHDSTDNIPAQTETLLREKNIPSARRQTLLGYIEKLQ